ncbi:MAG: methylated-DNA--[protein]-cysteine S-methyltransferase [Pikeienuella sp.]
MPSLCVETQFGPLCATEVDDAIVALTWRGHAEGEATPLLREAARQLAAYAAGTLTVFDLPLNPKGGPLQQDVMREMSAIPFGETRSYGDIAKALGVAAQPIGQACGANPIPVIIPCHRVTGSHGLGGFSGRGGVETKVALLRHEGAYGLLI